MSQVATTLILFTGSVAIAAVAVGVLGHGVQEVAHAGEARGERLATELRTDVRIINDPARIPTGPVRFYVKNTGTEVLNPNGTTLLVDGLVRNNATFTVLNATAAGRWSPGEVLEARDTTLTLSAGDHTVMVVAEPGVRDSLRVRV